MFNQILDLDPPPITRASFGLRPNLLMELRQSNKPKFTPSITARDKSPRA
jgi:hypothetical protein